MTDKELHKLKRSELLELLLCLREELDKLRAENDNLKQRLETIENDHAILERILHAVCPENEERESGA
ncbi:hypothetical protein [Ruminococcus sp.]|uniref:hypothetical protein n=1 Tax=Ruminococcus sp. TaxID=41978 RepID=UPI0025D3FF84|nr:hypothetical protein [Ruminococcus sp.]MDD7556181.1 hypothetical protein [Ruminococcus sp.]MDY4964211.1 hypothetical protein [Ruminococcus callidus]